MAEPPEQRCRSSTVRPAGEEKFAAPARIRHLDFIDGVMTRSRACPGAALSRSCITLRESAK
jgi:hypothetical protein